MRLEVYYTDNYIYNPRIIAPVLTFELDDAGVLNVERVNNAGDWDIVQIDTSLLSRIEVVL